MGTFRGDIYGIAVAFEVIAIVVAVWLLRRLALSQFLTPAVGFIVGLHFIGLWRATDLLDFVWVAIGMCVVCGVAALMPVNHGGDLRRAVAGIGSALVLWAAGGAALF